ncbi:MAG: DUF1501 domain-containing protein [Aquabacterium sp.]|nr:MAG: DUF1501 domain-containing protein [Aquabacterium sp.]
MTASHRTPQGQSRREFIKRLAALSAAGSAAPMALNLAAIGEAAAFEATDYKALVCVFLYGGNDYANSLVTYDAATHAAYAQLRSTVAFARDQLASTVLHPRTALPDGRQYALAPSVTRVNRITNVQATYAQLSPLLPLFDAGQLAVLLNAGPLVQPTTKADYVARRALPPKLFSHNDQQSVWQSLKPEGATSGWGGRLGDLAASNNGKATFTCINAAGNAVFLAGQNVSQFQVSTRGAQQIDAIADPIFGSAACADLLGKLVTADTGSHLFERELTAVMRRSLAAQGGLRDALSGVQDPATAFPANALGAQLRLVTRLIAARGSLGAKRQVFMVAMGGFDTHSALYGSHPVLMTRVGSALAAFQAALQEIGMADRVTTFTTSDFGRTLTANGVGEGAGSDHGWGGHYLVMGGAVDGGRFFGRAPVMELDGPDTVGSGRLLPSLSVDEYAAALGGWLGASDGALLELLPNWRRFVDPAAPARLPLFKA